MKKLFLLSVLLCTHFLLISQDTKKSDLESLLEELAENGCKCVDSIQSYNKTKDYVNTEISKCINKQASAYQMGSKLMNINDLKENTEEKDGKKQINITINVNENSKEYKKYYYKIERYMMDKCDPLKEKISTNEKLSNKSFSENEIASEFYNKGLDASKKGNYEEAVKFYKLAVKEDPEFAFAWDNLGINYRKLGMLDKAIDAYETSLKIEPNGIMPLQNIAVVYQYKKMYRKAIRAYRKLTKIDKNNPEIFYGIGNVYTMNLKDYEKGLDNMCIAYNIYVEQKSPYRIDAEKIIKYIYLEMKKQGKEEKFNQILKNNNISQN